MIVLSFVVVFWRFADSEQMEKVKFCKDNNREDDDDDKEDIK